MRYSSCTSGFTLATVNLRRGLLLVAAVSTLAALPPTAGAAPKKQRLHAFASCSRFVHYARRHATNELKTRGVPVGPPMFEQTVRTPAPDGTVAPQAESAPTAGGDTGQDFSTTNVQEAGVDEPDAVKTDGKRIFVVSNGTLFVVDARSAKPKLLGSLKLDGSGQELLLDGDRLLVMAGNPIYYPVDVVRPLPVTQGPATAARVSTSIAPIGDQTSTLSLIDVSDPGAMKVLKTMSVGGGYLSARLTGHTARVVFSATPRALPVLQTAMPEVRDDKISRSTTPDWRPSYTLRRGRTGKAARHALVRCTSIERPDVFSGLNSLTVLTINIAKGLDPVDADAVMTDGQTIYGSTKNLYVATQKAIVEQANSEQPPASPVTAIHKFDISDPDETVYRATGVVTGTLLNQYSMSEQDGLLRVASTDSPLWWSPGNNRPSESFVSVLKQDGNALSVVGRVGELGKGERIYAVRFFGDIAYVVTFRQVDPLYTVGLADPEHPQVLGSLDLLGYSAYLHPVGDGLLLGVGQAANEQGRTEGTQVSLFDVSDPKKPTRISNKVVGNGSSSSVEFDPHAFLWWDPSKLAVLPVSIYNYDQNGKGDTFSGAIGFHATKAGGVTEAGRASHPKDQYGYSAAISRSLVVGDRLFTVSDAGVLSSDLATFAEGGFAPFPAPQHVNPAPAPDSGTGTGTTGSPGQTEPSPPTK
jgi:uncharacterized secreted protein with C-terminal beta-propeller domain